MSQNQYRYYAYQKGVCVATVSADSIVGAIGQLTMLKLTPEHYDSLTTVYQPEKRSPGEFVDDSIDKARFISSGVVGKLGSWLTSGAKKLAPAPVRAPVGAQPPILQQ